jgi:SAM-dependent methyltransferase
VADTSLQVAITDHLARWGLRRFTSDDAYFQWQRQALSSQELSDLHRFVERKRRGAPSDETAFYDLTADPQILPVLYSQRYDYYTAIGSRVASRMRDAKTILDFGCGVGILTTFYARGFQDKQFVGIDRSPASVAAARAKANELGLGNVRFECLDVETEPLAGSHDLIIATHALVQAELDPGIPSDNWQTFERGRDARRQAEFEQRTGIDVRLDRLSAVLSPCGSMIVFEKTRQLARRVPFQRALASRGLSLVEQPEPIRYQLVEEVAEDGPFFVLQKGSGASHSWDESPEPDKGTTFDPALRPAQPTDSDRPLYENHWPSAQRVWEELNDREVVRETTRQAPDGRQIHVELGIADRLSYLYCANTFDQRQLVVVERANAVMLERYYQEIVSGL